MVQLRDEMSDRLVSEKNKPKVNMSVEVARRHLSEVEEEL